jgi:hypothetical protein
MSYQKVLSRVKELQSAPMDEDLGFTLDIRTKHNDRSEFTYTGCYYEWHYVDNGRWCIIIAPEHHPARSYEIAELRHLEIFRPRIYQLGPLWFWYEEGYVAVLNGQRYVGDTFRRLLPKVSWDRTWIDRKLHPENWV